MSHSLAAKPLCSELPMSVPLQHKSIMIATYKSDLLHSFLQSLKQDKKAKQRILELNYYI
jgi:hypothetical protein